MNEPAAITLAVLGQSPVKSTAYRWARQARRSKVLQSIPCYHCNERALHSLTCQWNTDANAIVLVTFEDGYYIVRHGLVDAFPRLRSGIDYPNGA